MSERERWIVYPLLFLALGASLRDKFTHQITTDRLHAAQLSCEQLLITDSEKPDRVVAKLTSNAPQPGDPGGDRYGVLALFDSNGKEFCGVTNSQLQVRQITCQGVVSQAVTVVDPLNQQQPLAVMSSATATAPDKSTRRIGSLLLTDDKGQALFGLVNDQLKMRQIVCEGVAVVDPENHNRTLAGLGSLAVAPKKSGGKPQRFGVLALNNEKFGTLTGNPPPATQAAAAPTEEKSMEESDESPLEPTEASPTETDEKGEEPANS